MYGPMIQPNMYGVDTNAQIEQQRMYREYMEDMREIQRTGEKEVVKQNVRLNAWSEKEKMKEVLAERKRGVFEEIEITPEGNPQIITRNLAIPACPRRFVNMQSPSITILKRLADKAEQIYLLECISGTQKKRLFLDKEKAGNGSYLVGKLGSEGICFMTNKAAKSKVLAQQLLAALLVHSPREKFLPDNGGYYETPDGSLKYAGKDDLTWNVVKKQSK